MTVDAVIVGSGPGGATAADILTAAGWSVVIFEKGRNHLLDLEDPTRLATDFSNDEIKFVFRHFLGPDPFLEPRTFRTGSEEGEHSFVGDVNSVPSTVGGGGTHADGKVPRFRQEDFRMLSTYGPQDGASVADWPLSYEDLEPFYTGVEWGMGVSGEAGTNPFAAWRSGPYPMPPGPAMYGATLSAAAAEKLGYHPYPAPGATNSVAYDGRPACNNCGFCSFFGCPIHAKGDPVAMLQRALLTGNAEIRPETFVSRIRTEGHRATGVDFIGPDGVERSLDARHVVVAGGAVETPRLLLLSGFDHPLIGRHLMVHFQTIVVGGFADLRFHTERGRAVTHVHDDPMIPDDASRAAAGEAGLPWMRGGWSNTAAPAFPSWRRSSTAGARSTRPTCGSLRSVTDCGPSPCRGRTYPGHQSHRSRPIGTRRPRLPGGPVHLPTPSTRAGGLGPPRAPAGRRPREPGGGVDARSSPLRALVTDPGSIDAPRPHEPTRDGHGEDGGGPGHIGGGRLRAVPRRAQCHRGRLLGLRHLLRLRTHPHPGRLGRPLGYRTPRMTVGSRRTDPGDWLPCRQ